MPFLADLTAMHQIVVGQYACHHRLTDWHSADTDAGIMAAFGGDLSVVAITIHGFARCQNGGRRLDRKAGDNGLSRRDTAENAAGVVRQEYWLTIVAHTHLIGVIDAAHGRRGKTVTDLNALDRIDTHQRGREIAVKLGIDRSAEACRHAFRHDFDHRAA